MIDNTVNKVVLKHTDPTCLEILSGVEVCREVTTFKKEYWVPGKFSKQKKEYDANFVSKSGKQFFIYAGFLNRIKTLCQIKGIEFQEVGERLRFEAVREPKLEGIEFRDIQIESIKQVIKHQNGILNLATGSGKTVTIAAILSCFNKPRMLFLARNNDLVQQAAKVFRGFDYDVCCIGAGNKEITAPIVCATAQSYKNLDLIKYSDSFDIITIDEAHIGVKQGSEYEKILSNTLAPIRIALTATVPEKFESALFLEGIIGEILVRAGTKAGVEEGILAKASVELLVIPENKNLKDLRDFQTIYKQGIVSNEIRNKIIAKAVKKEVDSGENCLIFCVELDHIQNLSRIFSEMGIIHECVFGDVSIEERLRIKNELNNSDLRAVISSVIWAQGLDLPNLSALFNASGGKSSEVLVQKAGRVLRVTDTKKTAKIYDCLDQSPPILASHCVKRIAAMVQNGWL